MDIGGGMARQRLAWCSSLNLDMDSTDFAFFFCPVPLVRRALRRRLLLPPAFSGFSFLPFVK